MMKHRNISQLQKIIFLRRIIAYLLVLRYADRLTSLDNKKSDATVIATYSYTLNAVGNITQSIQEEPLEPIFTASTTNYTYNTQKTRLLSAGSDTFAYDAEGQLASGYGNTYTFDYEHRLTAISGQQSAFSFFYDGIGNRLKAIRNSVTTKYVYDIDGNVIAEADTNNAITKYYVHGLGLLAMVSPGDQIYTYHFNNVGSTIAITDASQAIINKYSYDPFGVILNEQETFAQPFKYVGQYGVMYETNGFYYMVTRYYDSKAGIFTSEDTIGFAGRDANLKRYVGNDPVNKIDPLGLKASCNGCGPDDWRGKFVPNRPFFIIDFTSACNTHDLCYAKCGMKKATCDTNFKGDMGLLCYRAWGSNIDPKYPHAPHPMLKPCYLLAEAYYKAVSEHGDSAYREAQKNCCKK